MSTWSFGGYNLESFGVITELDDYLDMPERRGDDITIPFRHGVTFAQKFFDARSITIGLTIVSESAADLEAKMDALMAVLALGTQQVLSRTLESGAVRTALASVNKPIQSARPAPWVCKCAIEFTLTEPFFRSSVDIDDNTTMINANPKAMTVINPGNVDERAPVITLTGPLQNTVITNSTNGSILTYTGTIASPRVVTVQVVDGEFVATDDLGANKIGNIGHSGSSALLVLNPGNNTLSIADDTATTGTVKISFKAPYV